MLSGIRVLDLTQEPGFLAGKILAELGADVIKIEPPSGDLSGRRGPFLGGVDDPERSLLWHALNSSKRGITLSLEFERGRALLRELIGVADVLLETFAPGTLDAMNLGYADARAKNSGIVWASITPFGQTGPYAMYRAHDLVAVAMGGNPSMTGDPDRPPIRCSMPTAYYHAGPEAVIGVLTALYARGRSQQGDYIDVSMQEAQLSSLITGAAQYAYTERLGTRSGAVLGRTREIWRAKDGYVSFGLRGGAARIPNLIAAVEYMHENDLAPDWLREYDWSKYNHNTLADAEIARFEAVFTTFFATKTMRELYEEALKRRILLAPCNNAAEIVDQPQLRARDFFVTIETELGEDFEIPGFFAKSTARKIGVRRRAPRIGEHNHEVYAELGIDLSELETLQAQEII